MRSSGTVEELLSEIGKVPAHDVGHCWELWVPELLRLRGARVGDDIAMAILLDALLVKGFYPDGFTEGEGGRTYRYVCQE
ncbi:MAG TPA: hypothetical protein VLX28_17255 [Thermoanaerobaculia bacterium]|nr:hypothetical protein [Thermoanaerobaculia bacterium]